MNTQSEVNVAKSAKPGIPILGQVFIFLALVVVTASGFSFGYLYRELREVPNDRLHKEKFGVEVLYLAEPGSIRIRIEPKEDVETARALEEHIKNFVGARVQGESLLGK